MSDAMSLLTISDVVHLLKIKPSTLYARVAQDRIPAFKIGRLIRFHRDDIEAWLQTHRSELRPQLPLQRRRRTCSNHIDDLIAQAKREIYTPVRGKPDQDRATGKGDTDGSV